MNWCLLMASCILMVSQFLIWFHNSLYCRWQTRSVWSQPLKKSQTVSGPNGIRTNTPKTQSTGSSELRKPDDVLMHVATPWAVGSGVLLDITMRETQLIQSKFNQVWSLDSQMIVWIYSLQTNGPNPYPYNIVKPCMTLSMHNFSSIM